MSPASEEAYTYLIVGGGMTADAAARGIRELDSSGSIGIIGAESDPPYSRPPLSKGLWKGENVESIWRRTGEVDVELRLARRVTKVDTGAREVWDDNGIAFSYEKLLLATGGAPRRLQGDTGDVIYFRTLEDYRRLRTLAEQHREFVVVGGGFIGSELAASLCSAGCRVTMLFPENGIGARVFPESLSRFLVGYYREKGVDVRQEEKVAEVRGDSGRRTVITQDGRRFSGDAVVAGLGIIPEVELARTAGLDVDDGIVVDELLRTSDASIFAAGDVARFKSPALGKRMRVEHEDNALTMGRAAGRAMAGDTTPYNHLPFFYSDLFDLGYEAVGETDSRLETIAAWRDENREGVVYYMSGGRVVGVLLWGIFGKVDEARDLITRPGPFAESDVGSWGIR
jgi:NADPH-dependent 2,4-dienoyl-CoA reductase/sulfur reductase-like enzyme